MAECRDCPATNLHWGKDPQGRPVLMESVVHRWRCPAFKSKRKAKSEDTAIDKLFGANTSKAERERMKKLIAKAEQQ